MGEVRAAFGDPRVAPDVATQTFTDSSGRVGVRARIVLPDPTTLADLLDLPADRPFGLTLVYSDGDDGESQERLLATSQLRHGVWYSLGDSVEVDRTRVRCEVAGGQLETRLVPLRLTEGQPALTPWND